MSTPVQRGGSSSALTNGSAYPGASFLYAQMQHSGIGKQGAPDCRTPHIPQTPRALNQAQQRNVARQWMGLPPIESNRQRAGRQARLAASHVAGTVGHSLAQMAGLARSAWDGMHETFISGLPSLSIGFPGAAAQAPAQTPVSTPAPATPMPAPQPASGPAANEVAAEGPTQTGRGNEPVTVIGAIIAGTVGAALAGASILVYGRSPRKNAAISLNKVEVVLPSATDPDVPSPSVSAHAPGSVFPPPLSADQATGAATSVPAQLQTSIPACDANHPPAGQPGSD